MTLKEARESKRMTQQELAEKAKVAFATVSRAERKVGEIRNSTKKKIAGALKMKVEEIEM